MRCAELACAFTSNLCASKSGFGLSERRQSQGQGQGQGPGRTGEESSRWRRRLPQVLRQLHGSLEAAEPPGEVDPAIPVALTLTGLCCGLWSLLAPLIEALLWPLASWVLLAPQRRPPDSDQNRPL